MYVIVWEFEVSPERIDEFRTTYSSQGEWAKLFARAEGYLGTELLQSLEGPARFLTIDRWEFVEDFADFQQQFSEAYTALDAFCEGLTLSERKIGSFTNPEVAMNAAS